MHYVLLCTSFTVLLKSFMCHLQSVFFSIKNVWIFWYFNSTPHIYICHSKHIGCCILFLASIFSTIRWSWNVEMLNWIVEVTSFLGSNFPFSNFLFTKFIGLFFLPFLRVQQHLFVFLQDIVLEQENCDSYPSKKCNFVQTTVQ